MLQPVMDSAVTASTFELEHVFAVHILLALWLTPAQVSPSLWPLCFKQSDQSTKPSFSPFAFVSLWSVCFSFFVLFFSFFFLIVMHFFVSLFGNSLSFCCFGPLCSWFASVSDVLILFRFTQNKQSKLHETF